MTNVVVGFGRTGRSVARFFEERALSFWVADDHLDGKAKAELSALQHCEGHLASHLPPLTPQEKHIFMALQWNDVRSVVAEVVVD